MLVRQGPQGVFGLRLTGRSNQRTRDPPAWRRGAQPTPLLLARGSRCLQPVWEASSCLVCLQVAGQHAEAHGPGLEWPGRVLGAVCDPELLRCCECWRSLTPGESVPAALSSGHQQVPGD